MRAEGTVRGNGGAPVLYKGVVPKEKKGWVLEAADTFWDWVDDEAYRSWTNLKYDWEDIKYHWNNFDTAFKERTNLLKEEPGLTNFFHWFSLGTVSSADEMGQNISDVFAADSTFKERVDGTLGITSDMMVVGGGVTGVYKNVTKAAVSKVVPYGTLSNSVDDMLYSLDDAIPSKKVATDFYIRPNGEAIPSTGYRYIDTKFLDEIMDNNRAPGSYFSFDRFDSAAEARDALQISTDWSNAGVRGEI